MLNVFVELSHALAETVQVSSAGVVQVAARRRLPATGIIWSQDGVIVTAHHVVQRDDNITVGLPDGKTVSATLVGRDPSTDLAVLKVSAGGLTPLTLANPAEVHVGHLGLALGRPGASVQTTLGVVSAIGEGWRRRGGGLIDHYIQTDVVMYPGFSGGPLVGAAGTVMGLNTSGLTRGISLTIPVPTLSRVVESLMAHGKVQRGYLGVSTQAVRLPDDLHQQLQQETGLLLTNVEKDSPADNAGLLLGDTIVTFDNTAVRQHDDLLALLSGDRVGKDCVVKVVRGGQLQDATVTVGERT